MKFYKATVRLRIKRTVTMPENFWELPKRTRDKLVGSYYKDLELKKHGWSPVECDFEWSDKDELCVS